MAITLNQIAEICGVSRGTVDRALHNKGNVRPAVAERIKAVAAEYGYTPNRSGTVPRIASDSHRRDHYFGADSVHADRSGCRPARSPPSGCVQRGGHLPAVALARSGRTGLDDRESGRAASYQCAGDHAA